MCGYMEVGQGPVREQESAYLLSSKHVLESQLVTIYFYCNYSSVLATQLDVTRLEVKLLH